MRISGITRFNRESERPPLALGAIVTVSPGIGRIVIASRITQLEAGPLPVGPARPSTTVIIGYFIGRDHRDLDIPRVRIHVFERIRQPDAFAVISQSPGVRPDQIRAESQTVVNFHKEIRVLSDYEIRVRRHVRPRREGIINAIRERPAGQRNRATAAIVQLNILVTLVPHGMVVHDLVDHNVPDPRLGVGRVKRSRTEYVQFVRSIREPSEGHFRLHRPEAHRIQDAARRRIAEIHRCRHRDINRLTGRTERKIKIIGSRPLANGPEIASFQDHIIRELAFQQVGPVIAQIDVAQIDRYRTRIV